jgi:hypothetical protein
MNYSAIKHLVITVLFVITITGGKATAQDTVRITDFGYKPNSRENAVPFVNKALTACKGKARPVLVFPKGRYDFWPQYSAEKLYYESNTDVIPVRYCPILIEGFKNITLDGSGSDFIYHGRIQPITIDSSENVLVKNINIDWDIPMTAQAQVKDVNNEYLEIEINVLESPYIIEDDKIVFVGEGWKSKMRMNGIMEFDKNTGLIPPETGDLSPLGDDYEMHKAKEVKYGIVRMYHAFKRKPAIGNYLILRHSARDHAGGFVINSKNISFENMKFFQTAGLGILLQYSENLSFKAVDFVPNKNKNRYFSGHDDGLHFSNCKGLITVDSCKYLGLMDDPINVHGTSVRIIKKLSEKKLLCKFIHEQSIGLSWARAGEKIGFIENDAMNTFGTGIVESFNALNPTDFEITFKENIPAGTDAGDALENLTWVTDVVIKNNFFGSNRARGILITTPGKIIIEGNTFESSGAAILIAGDANNWYESGAVKDVLIQKNIFNDACMTSMYEFCEGIISIFPTIPKADVSKPFHKNIRIINNVFNVFDYPVLYAKSVDGITFSNNDLKRSMRFKPFHNRKNMITLEACKNIKIFSNKMDDNILGKDIKLIATMPSSLKTGKKQGLKIEN